MVGALIVGLGAGFGAILFRWLIDTIRTLAFTGGSQALSFMGEYYLLVIPAMGGLLVGPLVYYLARETKGHGVPEVMEAVALRGGRIRPIVVVIKGLASSICIGTGGSAGREGPIVQIGSALGSTLGQALKMSDDRIRTLVACGAAGGIAATFNAPVAGVLFALEVILGEFSAAHFTTVVIASVTASVVGRIFAGDVPAFVVPEYALQTPWELLFYVMLGVIAAPVGVGFVRMLYRMEDLFEAWNFPEYLKPAVGGLGVGVLGLFVPQVFGVGYGTIEKALHSEMALTTMMILLVCKMVATSLTLGSGGSGGVFAPSLFMGAMLGGAWGNLVHFGFPNITAQSGAYALVGMAAVFAAAARAPISAIIILFEMTGDYRIMLPLMLSTVIAMVLAGFLESESIYTLKLSRRGVHLARGRDVDVMQSVLVSEVMTTDTVPVSLSMNLGQVAHHFQTYQRHAFPVVDQNQVLCGIVSLQDLDRSLTLPDHEKLTTADISTRSLVTVYPDETIGAALGKMAPRDLSSLPVVDPNDRRRLLGVVRRRNIVRAYNLAIVRREEIHQKVTQTRLDSGAAARFVELEVTEDSPVVNRSLSTLSLPRGCVVVSIRRDLQVLIPHGDTVLRAGDKVTAFVETEDETTLKKYFLR